MHSVLQAPELVHHLFVYLQPAGCIDNHDAVARTLRILDSGFRDLHDILRRAISVDRYIELLTESLQLIDCRGTIDIGCDEARRASFTNEFPRELRGGGRLT